MNTMLDLGSWCILRMAGGDTLRLVNALALLGIEVWTPTERRFARVPRKKSRRDKVSAIMPSYAFGHVRDLDQLLHRSAIPGRDHPQFSVMRHRGGVPLIADDELDALRSEEARLHGIFERLKRRGVKAPSLPRGTPVQLSEGPFAGLSGIVEGDQGQYTLVSFAGFHKPLKISSLLLLPDSVMEGAKPALCAA